MITYFGDQRLGPGRYNFLLHLLQTGVSAEAIGNWWLGLFERQARLSIVYQERQPPCSTGKPQGCSMYQYCCHWTTDLWFKQKTEDVKVPTDYYLVQKWSPVGMIPFAEDWSQYTNGANMNAA